MKKGLQATLAALLALGTGVTSADEPARDAPACDLRSFDGSRAMDLKEFRGKVVYVDFWASWCASCAKSFPFLNALDDEFGDEGLQILGVNVDENIADANTFLAKRPASFALAADATGSCPRAFGVTGMPSSFLVDRAGQIREVFVGFRSSDAAVIRERVARLLAEPAAGGQGT